MERGPEDLLTALRGLHARLSVEMGERFARDLPFAELVFDRWERARQLGFGEDASIYHNTYVLGDVEVGRGTWIGPFVMLDGRAGIKIGDYCSISTGVQIYTHDTVRWALTGGKAEYELGPVTIGSCTYVGSGSVILHGVTIGNHCVIGAQSLVNRDIPPRTVAFGIPARPRGRVEIGTGGDVKVVVNEHEHEERP